MANYRFLVPPLQHCLPRFTLLLNVSHPFQPLCLSDAIVLFYLTPLSMLISLVVESLGQIKILIPSPSISLLEHQAPTITTPPSSTRQQPVLGYPKTI